MTLQEFRDSEYGQALGLALALVLVLGAISSLPGCDFFGLFLAPGMLLAAILFETGAHSDYFVAYVVVTGVLDTFLYGGLILWLRRFLKRRKR